jgi:uncharacterized membrane protein
LILLSPKIGYALSVKEFQKKSIGYFRLTKIGYFRLTLNGCFRLTLTVDNSSVCICYLTESTGGTAYTVDYAKKAGIRVINIA